MTTSNAASKLFRASILVTASLLAACDKTSAPAPATADSTTTTTTTTGASSTVTSAAPSPHGHGGPAMDGAGMPTTGSAGPAIGSAAPDFTLTDLDGKTVSLHDYRGKTVVLEWFNPHCPFVKASHTKGSLVDTASKEMASGVVWLSINSGAPGKEGAGADASKEGVAKLAMKNPVLLDSDGKVGHLYGATNTPDMYVIAPDGTLAYKGAIDNSPDGEGEAAPGGKLVNYVTSAIDALNAKKPVDVNETKAYGCGVKYGS